MITNRRLRVVCLLAAVAIGIGLAAVAPVSATASPSAGESVSTANDTFPVTLTDATGTAVTVESRPENVTTTNPSAAQTMWTLGAADQVVGVTQYASYLDGAEKRDNVSAAGLGVSIERVVATEPDLVLAPNATSVETVRTLRAANLTVFHFPAATDFEAVATKTQTIGRLTGNTAAAAETNAWMWRNVAATESELNDVDRPRVLYPLLGGFAVGNNTFIDEIITTAGGTNVAASEFEGYRQLNDETVITLAPEVLIVTEQTEGQILGSEPYSLTPAGETNRTATLSVQYLNQPAPRSVVYATGNLSAQLHPDVAATVTTTPDADGDDGPATDVSAPGFGVVVAVLSLVAVVASARFYHGR